MSGPADYDLSIVVVFVPGLLALLGGFFGAWLARRTEYEKWLRRERSIAFAEFIRQLHEVREKAIDVTYDHHMPENQRDIKVSELFAGLDGQLNIVRLYLGRKDRDRLAELKHKLYLLHGPLTPQKVRIGSVDAILLEIQGIFEKTIGG